MAKDILENLDEWYKQTPIDAYRTSKAYRNELRANKEYEKLANLTYGEIELMSFFSLLQEVTDMFPSRSFKYFLDIGSGSGKACFVAPIAIKSLRVSVGLEIVKPLHEIALTSHQHLGNGILKDIQADIKFHHCDSLAIASLKRWHEADLLFLPTTCFTQEAMKTVNEELTKVRPGTVVINTTRYLDVPNLNLISEKRYRYCKGSLKFLVYECANTS